MANYTPQDLARLARNLAACLQEHFGPDALSDGPSVREVVFLYTKWCLIDVAFSAQPKETDWPGITTFEQGNAVERIQRICCKIGRLFGFDHPPKQSKTEGHIRLPGSGSKGSRSLRDLKVDPAFARGLDWAAGKLESPRQQKASGGKGRPGRKSTIKRDRKWLKEFNKGITNKLWDTPTQFAAHKGVKRDTMHRALGRAEKDPGEQDS